MKQFGTVQKKSWNFFMPEYVKPVVNLCFSSHTISMNRIISIFTLMRLLVGTAILACAYPSMFPQRKPFVQCL